jgi:hypothetical protein
MVQLILIGLCAGAASALMFASVISGVLFAIVLFYLSPLPIMVAAIGFSHWTGLLAAGFGAVFLAIGFSPYFAAVFLPGVGAPAWWLGYLALLARMVTNGSDAATEWYPPGRLALWAAVLGGAAVAVALLGMGGDEASIRAGLKGGIEQMFETASLGGPAPPASEDKGRMIDFLAAAMPPAAAVIAALAYTLNLWLASRIALMSGLLRRPWPDLAAMVFPPAAALALALAVALSFVSGLAGVMAGLFAATLLLAFAMLGFAVMHQATRGMRMRPIILTGAYALAAAGWPVLLMSFVGVAESVLRLRDRRGFGNPPPAPTG